MVKEKGFFTESKKVTAWHRPSMGDIAQMNVEMKNGRQVAFFVNRKSGLIVGDVVDKDGMYCYEFLRTNVDKIPKGRPKKKLKKVV